MTGVYILAGIGWSLIAGSAALSAVFSNDIVCLAVAPVLLDACRRRGLGFVINPASLDQLTWLFPADRYAEPRVESGQASITRQGNNWMVVAGPGKARAVLERLARGAGVGPQQIRHPLHCVTSKRVRGVRVMQRHLDG